MDSMFLIRFIVAFFVILFFAWIVIGAVKNAKLRKKLKSLSDNTVDLTPEEFFKLRNASYGGRGRKHISNDFDFSGVYILYNRAKDKYYVGQGKKLFQRVNHHFTGYGNGAVYADYKNGDAFTIKLISLKNSGFSSLNELERNYIRLYHGYSKGYNKTRGNQG